MFVNPKTEVKIIRTNGNKVNLLLLFSWDPISFIFFLILSFDLIIVISSNNTILRKKFKFYRQFMFSPRTNVYN